MRRPVARFSSIPPAPIIRDLRQQTGDHVDGHCRSKTAPPRIYTPDDLIGGPDEKAASEDQIQGCGGLACRRPDPAQSTRRHHDPKDEVWPLCDRNRTGFAIAEEPNEDTAQRASPGCQFATSERPVAGDKPRGRQAFPSRGFARPSRSRDATGCLAATRPSRLQSPKTQ